MIAIELVIIGARQEQNALLGHKILTKDLNKWTLLTGFLGMLGGSHLLEISF